VSSRTPLDFHERASLDGPDERRHRLLPFTTGHHLDVHGLSEDVFCLRLELGDPRRGNLSDEKDIGVGRRRPSFSDIARRPGAVDISGFDAGLFQESTENRMGPVRLQEERAQLREERVILIRADETRCCETRRRDKTSLLEPIHLSLHYGVGKARPIGDCLNVKAFGREKDAREHPCLSLGTKHGREER
jgi:hypothetical protein